MDLKEAISAYGAAAKAKLANPSATGQPEDQIRTPFENLLRDLAGLCGLAPDSVSAVGETSLSDLKTRPDFAVTVRSALVGHVELKAPGKGAEPRRFRDPHDKSQWEKLKSLPNLIYSDGNEFSLWHNGELALPLVRLSGDIESAGANLSAPEQLTSLFETFLRWQPIPPRSAKELAVVSARLCRLLREEVTEQLGLGSTALTSLATDWRKLLFPEATDERFADGYAQAVTFGLLMARAKGVALSTGFHEVARQLDTTSSLIGAALRLLTDDAENQQALRTSLGVLTRVLDAVDWPTISKGDAEAWLYFYEDFLEVYDNKLRKQTGSYYTPPEVVEAMVRLVDEELRGQGFRVTAGIASPLVTLADPAVGTGTFILGILRRIAETVRSDQGEGAVPGAISDAVNRLIAFELQLGPFAVAQLRILAEIVELTGAPPASAPKMFVTDTLADPEDEEGWIPGAFRQIANSRRDANRVKREQPITVVIGNPPYKEKARGQGAWVEGQASAKTNRPAPLADWMPPPEWGVGAHLKHLRNLYVYFWRWATWKVFDHGPGKKSGIVCFISMAGFLNGPGFQRMREYLRQTCDRIWVIDCSPEGHQPEVNTRIFQGVQQPICIVLASRTDLKASGVPAQVLWRALPKGERRDKFEALKAIRLDGPGWTECPDDWKVPFLPASSAEWTAFPALDDYFAYNGSGVQPKRTWVIAPDAQSLQRRWEALLAAPADRKEELFHPTLRNGIPADRHIRSVVREAIPGYAPNPTRLVDESGPSLSPSRYGFRSFDRQWVIPDNRVITQANAELWTTRPERRLFLTATMAMTPPPGPGLTVTCLVPDLDHYGGRGGRVFPLWADQDATVPNIRKGLLELLGQRYGREVAPDEVFAYIVGLGAHPGFTARFRADLATPGLRIPLTADEAQFCEVVKVGRQVVWLHTFGERMADDAQGRPASPPRLPEGRRPLIPREGSIPLDPESMPDSLSYDATQRRLYVGKGYIENVEPAVWAYEVSGKQVIKQWFSYRRKDRDRPIIGDRRKPSPLGDIQPDHWLSEYTTELLNLVNVLALLVDTEPAQAALLEAVCAGPLIARAELEAAGLFQELPRAPRRRRQPEGPRLFD